MGTIRRWLRRARFLKSDLYVLYLAYRDPRVPRFAKMFAALVVGYAFSPVDLIPDFIPVLGYLDDLVLVPLGIGLAIRMIPPPVLADCRERARHSQLMRRTNWVVGGLIIGFWLILLLAAAYLLTRIIFR